MKVRISSANTIREILGPAERIGRRRFVAGAGAAGLSLTRAFPVVAQSASVDYTIRIAPVSVELAPDKVIKTYRYNGMVPGPVLRLQAGRQVSINIVNDRGAVARSGEQ